MLNVALAKVIVSIPVFEIEFEAHLARETGEFTADLEELHEFSGAMGFEDTVAAVFLATKEAIGEASRRFLYSTNVAVVC